MTYLLTQNIFAKTDSKLGLRDV